MIKYPSQYEAEAMRSWFNAFRGLHTSNAPMTHKALEKAEEIRRELHIVIFGDDSPWSLEYPKSRRGLITSPNTIVVWDKHKAEHLGIK